MVFIVDSSRLSRGAFLLERTITCHVEPLDYRVSRTVLVSSARLIEDGELCAKLKKKKREKILIVMGKIFIYILFDLFIVKELS